MGRSSPQRVSSPLAIISAAMIFIGPLVAWIIVSVCFPGEEQQAAADSGNARWAVAMLGVGALFRAAFVLFELAVFGLVTGVASLMKRERLRSVGIVATSVHSVVIISLAIALSVAIHNLAE